ncbi:hypothetical protein [Methanohalophilus sp.]|uniref:hypothetical protein n=1 Tax=Methanohalophilus sp. TaxID=1966352 RepID=UPI00261A831D|nr:hypothetical protein [Methanohalophilus sp.]
MNSYGMDFVEWFFQIRKCTDYLSINFRNNEIGNIDIIPIKEISGKKSINFFVICLVCIPD